MSNRFAQVELSKQREWLKDATENVERIPKFFRLSLETFPQTSFSLSSFVRILAFGRMEPNDRTIAGRKELAFEKIMAASGAHFGATFGHEFLIRDKLCLRSEVLRYILCTFTDRYRRESQIS